MMLILRRLFRWLLHRLEKTLHAFYEGPQAPPRLAHAVDDFARSPRTHQEWKRFSLVLAQSAWEQGFIRGFEQRISDIEHIAAVYEESKVEQGEQVQKQPLESVEMRAEKVEATVTPFTTDRLQQWASDVDAKKDLETRAEYWKDRAGVGPKR